MSQTDLPAPRVALYASKATDIRTLNSVETQLAACRNYAHRQRWSIEMELCDKDISETHEERPGFQALCRAVESRAVDIVLFVSLDRISRDADLVRKFQLTADRTKVELHQVDYGNAQLLDLALLAASEFKRLALRRAARMKDLSTDGTTSPSK